MNRVVFVCHASQDADTARAIVEGLEARGLGCWLAPRDVPLGAQYAEAIVTGISAARALVLVFSGHSNESPHVTREVERAVSRGLPVFPIKVSDDDPSGALEYFISSAQWLDVTANDLAAHIPQLANRLGEVVGPRQEASGRVASRDALRNAIARLGPGLVEEPRRVEAILRDLAGEHKAAVAALSVAAAEGVGSALLAAPQGMHEGLMEQLTRRLQENRGLAADMARWAVETWGSVLGVGGQVPLPAEFGEGGATVPVTDQSGKHEPKPDVELETTPVEPTPSADPVKASRYPGTAERSAPTEQPAESGMLSNLEPVELPESGSEERTPTRPVPPSTIPAEQGQTKPLKPPSVSTEAVPLTAHASGRRADRWKMWAGLGTAVVSLTVVGVIISGGNSGSPGTSATTPDTVSPAGVTTTFGVTTTTTRGTTTVATTTTVASTTTTRVMSTPCGNVSSDICLTLPYSQSFTSRVWVDPWGIESNSLGTYDWDIVAGQLSFEAELAVESIQFFRKVRTYFPFPSSFVASVEVSQPTSDGVACGLTLHHDEDWFYGLYFLVDSFNQRYGVWGPASRENATREAVIPPTFDSRIRRDAMNELEVVADGENLGFVVNGEPLVDLTGWPRLSGIGMGAAVEPGDGEECRYDNYSVTTGS